VLQILREQLYSIHSVLKIFQILYTYTTEVKKKNKNSKTLTKINSTESYTRNMVLKFLPEPIHELSILKKRIQDLSQHDKLVMQLT